MKWQGAREERSKGQREQGRKGAREQRRKGTREQGSKAKQAKWQVALLNHESPIGDVLSVVEVGLRSVAMIEEKTFVRCRGTTRVLRGLSPYNTHSYEMPKKAILATGIQKNDTKQNENNSYENRSPLCHYNPVFYVGHCTKGNQV